MTNSFKSVELVIFDCDGVLVDSERLATVVEAELITELGWPLTQPEVVERFVGRSDEYMLGEIEAHLGRAVPEWDSLYKDRLYRSFQTDLTAVDGVVAALDAIDGIGLMTCVASSGTHDKMRLTLGLTGLFERFDGHIFSTTQVARGKPEPDLFLFAASQMNIEPARCLVVEDSPSGIQAAIAADMRCIAFASGLIPVERLCGFGATVIHHMSELPALISQSA